MIRLVEALNYRCLRYSSQTLGGFHVLVGPNASGKSTFLDTIRLLGGLLTNGLDAIRDRSPGIHDLVWMGEGKSFELAVELEVPAPRRARLQNNYDTARYEVAIGLNGEGELAILGETLWLKPASTTEQPAQRKLFPRPPEPAAYLVLPEGQHAPQGWKKTVVKKLANDYFISETTKWNNPFRLGPQKLALANLPEDEERFPVSTWVKRVLMEGVQHLVLNSEAMRRPAPPGAPREFQPDGSNLPWAVEGIRKTDPTALERWVSHVRTALPDVQAIDTVERPEDRHRYLRITYATGLQAPSWILSDGTLRLLALTLVAYLPARDRVFLIEEPENGIHPQAVETVFQSLSSAYDSQILCASHSPVVLSLVAPRDLLCFGRTPDGVTDILRGDLHPGLRDWRRDVDLGTLFAAGVLG